MLNGALRRWLGSLTAGLAGPVHPCLHCGRPLEGASQRRLGLCPACRLRVAWVRPPLCPRCGKPVTGAGPGEPCEDCRGRLVPFRFSRAAAVYDGLWRDLIHQFKFHHRRELATTLGVATAEAAWEADLPLRVHALVPVPLHPQRLARRGYNQALELAMVIAEETGVPVLEALVRTARGQRAGPQSLRTARQRRRCMRGAFVAWQPGVVRGLSLAVVDDVYTTGATMDEASRALLRAGAREVFGLVAAVGVSDADLGSGSSAEAGGAARWR